MTKDIRIKSSEIKFPPYIEFVKNLVTKLRSTNKITDNQEQIWI